MDYAPLRDFLKAGEWRKAEDETRALLIRLAGEDAIKRGWVYFTEVRVPGGERGAGVCAVCGLQRGRHELMRCLGTSRCNVAMPPRGRTLHINKQSHFIVLQATRLQLMRPAPAHKAPFTPPRHHPPRR